MSWIKDRLPVQEAPWVEKGFGCATCHGTQIVYVMEDYVVGGLKWLEWEVPRPCPDCSGICNTCWDMGVVKYAVPIEHPAFGKLYACPHCAKGREMATNLHRAELRNAQLPDQYKDYTFESWDALPDHLRVGKEMARIAAGFFAETGIVQLDQVYAAVGQNFGGEDAGRRSLVFQGEVGVGKTGLAAAILNYCITYRAHLPKPLYIRTLDALESIKARFGQDNPTPEEVLDTFKRTKILILDEFNVKQGTDWRLDHIESIVRYRYNNNLPTIFTMNIDRFELEKQWGIQTASAVMGMAHWFELKGERIRDHGTVITDF